MGVKTFIAGSVHDMDKAINNWLTKNDSKIKLHDIKVQYCGYTGKLIYVIIYDHVAIEEIED